MSSTVWGHCGVARPEDHKLRKSEASTFCTLWRLTGQYSRLATFSGVLEFGMTSHSFFAHGGDSFLTSETEF